ncbi:hypothetical protein [Erythrobacter sp.]|nr:hypothetical protein [Erythrobacter sp.]
MKNLIVIAALVALSACEPASEPRPEPTLVPIENECPEGEVCP